MDDSTSHLQFGFEIAPDEAVTTDPVTENEVDWTRTRECVEGFRNQSFESVIRSFLQSPTIRRIPAVRR